MTTTETTTTTTTATTTRAQWQTCVVGTITKLSNDGNGGTIGAKIAASRVGT